jgi:tetratricopeptide (TPR) repeat protein
VETEANPTKTRLRILLEDNVSQQLSEEALKGAWEKVLSTGRYFLVEKPILGEFTQRAVLLFAALFFLSTITGVLSSSYWSMRESIAREEFERARGLNAQGQHERALRYLRSAFHLEHHNREYQMALATTLVQLRRFDEAVLQFDDLLRQDPTNAEANVRLARIAADQGEESLDIAVQYFQRAIYGLWHSNPTENRIRTRFELVDFLAAHDRIDLLRAELILLANDLRDDPDQLERTGFLMLYAQIPDNAIAVFERLMAVAPNNPRATAGLGKAYLDAGNFPLAERWLLRAQRINTENQAVADELALVREIRSLNPMMRGLTRRARAERARLLLTKTYEPLQACSQRRVLPEDVQEYLQSASERANIPRGAALADDETDADLAISRQLYDHYMTYCEDEPAPEAVIRLMASLARN